MGQTPSSSFATCANGVTTVTVYSASSTCTGASSVQTYQAGCQVVTQGSFTAVFNVQCAATSGAGSAALAATSALLVALAMAAAMVA